MKSDALPRKRRRTLRKILFSALGLFIAIQLIPYGRDHSNPPVTQEPTWDSAQTRAMVQTSCFDCHSNQVNWYFYTNVAPFSWLTQRDVDTGRAALNFSEWNLPHDAGAGDVVDVIREGTMPPWYYTIVHRSARLSPGEKQQLIAGLEKTFQVSPPVGGGG